MQNHGYYVYFLTNPKRTVLYIGITNDLKRRLTEHVLGNAEKSGSFTSRYFCYNLIYFEYFDDVQSAISREKQLKKWSRSKKEALIEGKNPDWEFIQL